MRPRYLLLAHPRRTVSTEWLDLLSGRTGLKLAFQDKGIALLVSDTTDLIALPGQNGVIVGTLFHRYGLPERIRVFPPDSANSVTATAGRHLVERFWGGYVAAIATTDGICVLRDPSAMVPCYHSGCENGVAFASDAPLLVDAGLVTPTIDWDAAGRVLYEHDLPSAGTAIAGIGQVRAGFARVVKADDVRDEEYWTPWDHVRSGYGRSAEENVEVLGRAVRQVIAAWASCYDNVLAGLSGGLDSSIIAVCLAASKANLTCLTLVTEDPVGDERDFARAICESIGAELIEKQYAMPSVDLGRSVAADVPCPNGKVHEEAYNSAVRRVADRHGVDAFFTGLGGDSVFYLTHSSRPLVDRYMEDGWSIGLWSTAQDICSITGASVWQVLREARRVHRIRRAGYQWHLFEDFLHADFVAAERKRPVSHPWLDRSGEMPPGKQGHLATLLRAINHMEHRDKALAVPLVSPLMSQPIIEAALGIPSWEFCRGGVDRAVARQAFARRLPPKIVNRRGKGGPDGFVAQIIHRHRAEIRERLLEGRLVRHGLLDRAALDHTLQFGTRLRPQDYPRIMALLDTEAWASHWADRSAGPLSAAMSG
ncbi:MAG: asparagine synthase-related protein [Pseudomonadota bacterium]|jgi:asparagine synthase (glutamine-hydrolysing)|uniref:asparagine synthase-related protein n=1 Tax=unclassified Sphingomonas TaxID=196159 RepID=UPI0010F66AB1|nr:asparagine synthase-related protein [Sphingomonas sp. 3F27F9]